MTSSPSRAERASLHFLLRPRIGASLAFIATAALGAPLTGCPGDEPCSDYSPPAAFDATTPTVAFSKDVMPIFAKSCASTQCHGNSATSNGVYLGSSTADVHRNLVDARSRTLPTMSYVKAGDARESFLMRKMDASHCVLDAQCRDGDCGASMPNNEEPLDVATRDVVRRWIAQGAKND